MFVYCQVQPNTALTCDLQLSYQTAGRHSECRDAYSDSDLHFSVADFMRGLHWGRKLHNGGAVVSSVWASLGCSLSTVSLKVFVWSVRLRKSNINTAPCTEHLKNENIDCCRY